MPDGRTKLRDLRGVGRPVGAVMIGVGIIMALTTTVAATWDLVAPSERIPQGGALACFASAALAAAIGAAVFGWSRRSARGTTLTRREALLSVTLIWFGAGVCGALPFLFGARMGAADAFFESVSGLTTTGATVITDIEARLSRPLLLWRSMLQWLGGMGIVVLFVAVFPSLGAGGKHLYKGEAPGAQIEGLRPRIAETSITLWKIYVTFTVILLGLLIALGMDPFEALCHALTTLATGGFSTRDGSIGAFESPTIEWVISVFMLLAGVSYGLYFALLRTRRLKPLLRSVEFRTYVWIIAVSTALLTVLNLHRHAPLDALRYALFMVGTNISSTGYGVDDYTQYSQPAFGIVLMLMFVGGCAGSTAGGIKVERIVMMAKQTLAQVQRSYEPSVVQVVRMGRAVIAKPVVADVMSFFAVYMASMAIGIFVVSVVDGVPLPTAFGAMLTSLSNMGPAPFHDTAGFADNFAAYSPVSKVFFACAMVIGRLEFFTFFALLIPGFWRR
ncbi:MAG: hypothetical protein KF901_14160 [Myxococcales bacterium]|nr:hypothetical protein [Myxococcales bacterium]